MCFLGLFMVTFAPPIITYNVKGLPSNEKNNKVCSMYFIEMNFS